MFGWFFLWLLISSSSNNSRSRRYRGGVTVAWSSSNNYCGGSFLPFQQQQQRTKRSLFRPRSFLDLPPASAFSYFNNKKQDLVRGGGAGGDNSDNFRLPFSATSSDHDGDSTPAPPNNPNAESDESVPVSSPSAPTEAPAAAAATMTSTSKTKPFLPLAEKAREYLTKSTDPFHAVHNAVQLLKQHGFVKWSPYQHPSTTTPPPTTTLQPGGKYYYTVQQSTLVAFTVGGKAPIATTATTAEQPQPAAEPIPFCIIGGHTDSPNFRIKPRSKCTTLPSSKHGCIQLGVECYGGGLWHTWLDRDLSVSGKVLVRSPKNDSNDNTPNKITSRLVQLQDPIARISSLCIHLQTADERKALALNKETHTVPIIASAPLLPTSNKNDKTPTSSSTMMEEALQEQINQPPVAAANNDDATTIPDDPWHKGQEPLLLQRIAQELDISIAQIADWDLSLYDVQPAAVGGMQSEFLYSGRLDNLATVFCSITALCDFSSTTNNGNDDASHISLVCAFDHEEVGSVSSHGAGSPVLQQAIQQISHAVQQGSNTPQYPQVVAKSFCMSVDQAHAVHPNYAAKHENAHGPLLNTGLVIKSNSNQRYATNSLTGFIVRELGRQSQVPIQEFVVRNDCPCGSTIGPTISARTGIRTIDLGMPQLSMHSCREVMGTVDLTHAVNLFQAYFQNFTTLDQQFQFDTDE